MSSGLQIDRAGPLFSERPISLRSSGLRRFGTVLENAQKALDVLEGEPNIDLIFTDVVLPGDMDGYALARTLKERYPRPKILMTSGFPGMRFNGSELAERLPLLSKPYRKEDLIRMVREVLDERSADGVS